MDIRPFRTADEPAVIQLWRDCGLTRPWNDPARDIARKRLVQPELFLVGVEADAVVATAMAGYDGHRGWINFLAVAPVWRRRGFAVALLQAAETRLSAVGCPKVNLQIRRSNRDAVGFYERIGYREDAVVSYGRRLIVDPPPVD